jgi:lipopolysaccharide transport system ATP-binding protein
VSDIAISVKGLGKLYHLGNKERYRTLRDTLTRAVMAPVMWFKEAANGKLLMKASHVRTAGEDSRSTIIWALRDVSFAVKRGEVVGIIGRNGAGKSTLLKILSRITEPTTGEARIHGRVGSLLEVGTGFHPELTGRENIYLNGAILGMKKSEIDSKFDAIVAFAEVEKFVDMPVKRYSSGMYVRLGFSVAAHLEPEILIVDEVLAVGDAAFQSKCLGKIGDVSNEGRTVLFVSHNMAAIQTLCPRVFLLENGILRYEGKNDDAIAFYLKSTILALTSVSSDLGSISRTKGLAAIFTKALVNGQPIGGTHIIPPRGRLEFELTLSLARPMKNCTVGLHFDTEWGLRLYALNSRWTLRTVDLNAGIYVVNCSVAEIPLVPGRYYISLGFSSDKTQIDWVDRIGTIEIAAADVYGTGELPWSSQGYYLSESSWRIERA